MSNEELALGLTIVTVLCLLWIALWSVIWPLLRASFPDFYGDQGGKKDEHKTEPEDYDSDSIQRRAW